MVYNENQKLIFSIYGVSVSFEYVVVSQRKCGDE